MLRYVLRQLATQAAKNLPVCVRELPFVSARSLACPGLELAASWSRSFAAQADVGGGSGGGEPSPADAEQLADAAWQQASSLSAEATELAEDGDMDGAKKLLHDKLPYLVEEFGRGITSVGLVHNQLSLWHFNDGEYPEALKQARAAQGVWIQQQGEDSSPAAFHGIRVGMALCADGRPDEAFPLLEQGLTVAISNFNEQLSKLEALETAEQVRQVLEESRAEEESTAAAADGPAEDPESTAAREVQEAEQHTARVMLDNLGRAVQEAKFYRALSFIGASGREINANWEDKGAGAAFFLQQEMSDAVRDIMRWKMPNHPTVQCMLREHGRLVAQCEKAGLRRLFDDLQIHGQRLHDLVHEAGRSEDKDG